MWLRKAKFSWSLVIHWDRNKQWTLLGLIVLHSDLNVSQAKWISCLPTWFIKSTLSGTLLPWWWTQSYLSRGMATKSSKSRQTVINSLQTMMNRSTKSFMARNWTHLVAIVSYLAHHLSTLLVWLVLKFRNTKMRMATGILKLLFSSSCSYATLISLSYTRVTRRCTCALSLRKV